LVGQQGLMQYSVEEQRSDPHAIDVLPLDPPELVVVPLDPPELVVPLDPPELVELRPELDVSPELEDGRPLEEPLDPPLVV
jgi:hypothetical protein